MRGKGHWLFQAACVTVLAIAAAALICEGYPTGTYGENQICMRSPSCPPTGICFPENHCDTGFPHKYITITEEPVCHTQGGAECKSADGLCTSGCWYDFFALDEGGCVTRQGSRREWQCFGICKLN